MAAAPAGPRGTGAARRALAPPLQVQRAPVTALPHLARPLGGAPRGDGPRLGRSGAAAAFPLRPPEQHSTRAVLLLARKLCMRCRGGPTDCVGASHGHTQTQYTHIRSFSSWSRARVANGSSRSRGSVGGLFPILSAGTTHHSPAVGRLPRRRVGWRVAVPGTGCGLAVARWARHISAHVLSTFTP